MTLNKKVTGIGGATAAILAAVFAMEGGYVNDPKDPGGETNHGITVAVARDFGYAGPMKAMPQDVAANIYVTNYINKPGYVLARPVAIPRRTTGVHPVDILLKPAGEAKK